MIALSVSPVTTGCANSLSFHYSVDSSILTTLTKLDHRRDDGHSPGLSQGDELSDPNRDDLSSRVERGSGRSRHAILASAGREFCSPRKPDAVHPRSVSEFKLEKYEF